MDKRNIIDRYKNWTEDLIREDIRTKQFPYAVLMEHWLGDFNMGTLIRNANAFGAKEVYYLGKRGWDRRAAVGTHVYTKVNHIDSVESLVKIIDANNFSLVGIETGTANKLPTFKWPENPLMVFGEEGSGITKEVLALCCETVEIPMFGSVRSLNAGVASGIAMNDFVTKCRM